MMHGLSIEGLLAPQTIVNCCFVFVVFVRVQTRQPRSFNLCGDQIQKGSGNVTSTKMCLLFTYISSLFEFGNTINIFRQCVLQHHQNGLGPCSNCLDIFGVSIHRTADPIPPVRAAQSSPPFTPHHSPFVKNQTKKTTHLGIMVPFMAYNEFFRIMMGLIHRVYHHGFHHAFATYI